MSLAPRAVTMSSHPSPFAAAAVILLGGATLLSYAGASPAAVFTAVGLAAALLWCVSIDFNVLAYVGILAFQVFQSLVVFRVAVSDFFMVPAAALSLASAWRGREGWPKSSLWRPLALLALAILIGNVIALVSRGRLSSYVIVNKDFGIVYLFAAFVTLARFLKTRAAVERVVRAFVLGVSVANITALGGAVLAVAGVQNHLYLIGNLRLYGWMLNPNLFGDILLTAAMIELAALTTEPDRSLPLRWLNLWLLAIGIVLTISRGTWLAASAAAAVLLLLQFRVARNRIPAMRMAAVGVWILLPALTLVGIVLSNPLALALPAPEQRAAQLKEHLVSQCAVNPYLDVCASVQMPSISETAELKGAPTPSSDTAPGPAAPETPGASAPVIDVGASFSNARGLNDRLAILGIASRQYFSSPRTILLGIGLGTFLETSSPYFGVPLIIHNTFAWFLFEMGPLGLIAVSWIWVSTVRSLSIAASIADWRRPLAFGLFAGFASLTVFCILNEGFYQRHLWLVFTLADRLPLIRAGDPA